ncbi:SMP-30/gluconolactonase/LRE family protein [Streptomyces pactum]|uniref:SMP-30/gluconolactonase/LRE family protein n=1 Tax=Streptomyces pactum TaxID=68249 RepID=A0ABS0NKZ3_9ACTN|nr:SMP-30/gluconolactonase/LRE family protein [Streptomyces pactum]MBH5335857.1 SMP-30/gluconolactonase/LRE family protein [Streptomyces pactum]
MPHARRTLAAAGLALLAGLTLAPSAPAATGPHPTDGRTTDGRTTAGRTTDAPTAADHTDRADRSGRARVSTAYVLPGDRVYPEGIGADPRSGALYVSSFTTGTIYRITPGRQAAEVFLPAGTDGRTTAGGLKVDRAGRLWVVDRGGVSVYATGTRRLLARFETAGPGSWLNDVALAPDGTAYLTDSTLGVVHHVTPAQLRKAMATGRPAALHTAFDLAAALDGLPPGFALNGIAADPSGRYLLTVDMVGGGLYRLDPASGGVSRVDLHGAVLTHADGLELRHGTLWVAHNSSNTISRLRLSADAGSARLERRLTDPALQVPTTLVRRDGHLLVVRSQFDKGGPMGPGTPEAPFTVAAVHGI